MVFADAAAAYEQTAVDLCAHGKHIDAPFVADDAAAAGQGRIAALDIQAADLAANLASGDIDNTGHIGLHIAADVDAGFPPAVLADAVAGDRAAAHIELAAATDIDAIAAVAGDRAAAHVHNTKYVESPRGISGRRTADDAAVLAVAEIERCSGVHTNRTAQTTIHGNVITVETEIQNDAFGQLIPRNGIRPVHTQLRIFRQIVAVGAGLTGEARRAVKGQISDAVMAVVVGLCADVQLRGGIRDDVRLARIVVELIAADPVGDNAVIGAQGTPLLQGGKQQRIGAYIQRRDGVAVAFEVLQCRAAVDIQRGHYVVSAMQIHQALQRAHIER